MVPQRWEREKVNRLKLKIFLIGHIYEVKIISLLSFSFRQLCGTIIRLIFYKCDILPNFTHLELQTAKLGQNLAKSVKNAKNFVFDPVVFSSYHLLGIQVSFSTITSSSGLYCDLQLILKVELFLSEHPLYTYILY